MITQMAVILLMFVVIHWHKHPYYLAQNNIRIGIEDLNVPGMMAHNLSNAIADADMVFYQFSRQLGYKCKLYGSELVVVDR
ncbi:MAG: hypothetical protein EA414_10300 [Arthrospira sp. PLM2.Bin9]|nr:hypothetical protein [Arthrospira sp. PLM2.Bin9]TVU53824.1 MAG: hypothetical protein EA414_10300 [Arthrospira sp. PLM2.Bin9]